MATSDGHGSRFGRLNASRLSWSHIRAYEGVVLFASDGANTVYGFDRFRDGEIVEGDWIGLNRDELIARGTTFAEFLRSISD
jgi:hypothetical protein